MKFSNSNKYTIRKATQSDIESIAYINAESWKTTYRNIIDKSFLDTLSREQQIPRAKRLVESAELFCIVATEKQSSEVIGFACFGKNREKNVDADSELQAIYLLETSQGYGAGKLLFDTGVQLLVQKQFKKMIVSVFEANKLARKFYERQGGKLISSDHVNLAGVLYPTSTYLWELTGRISAE